MFRREAPLADRHRQVRTRMARLTNDDRVRALPGTTGVAPAVNGGSRSGRSDIKKRSGEPHIGRALKSVYDQTVSEAIPSEMLDLLGRLD